MVTAPHPGRPAPRISCNDLALFLVSSSTAQIGIAKRSKYPPTVLTTRYKDVRPVIAGFLTDPARPVKALVAAEQMFQQRIDDPASSTHRVDDAHSSIAVLHALQGMSNKLATLSFYAAPHSQPKLILSDVEVSVRADVLVGGVIKGAESGGAAVFRMTQAEEGEAAKDKRKEMGLYVATLARLHAEQNLKLKTPLANRLCLSIDVQHGEAFAAPDASTRRINDLESACRMIAALWPGL